MGSRTVSYSNDKSMVLIQTLEYTVEQVCTCRPTVEVLLGSIWSVIMVFSGLITSSTITVSFSTATTVVSAEEMENTIIFSI